MKKLLMRNKKGFTLIELMVVIAIIGVLALLGLRLYTGQQDKAKNAIVKANVGTIQTLIQAELADRPVTDLDTPGKLSAIIFADAGIHNPVTDNAQTECPANVEEALAGEVWVTYSNYVFTINGRNTVDNENIYVVPLTARK